MVLAHREPRIREPISHLPFDERSLWPTSHTADWPYSLEEEMLDQLGKLPDPERVREVVSLLRVTVLRQLATEVVNGGIQYIRQGDRHNYARLLNSWMATAEEACAAGRRWKTVAARRKTKS